MSIIYENGIFKVDNQFTFDGSTNYMSNTQIAGLSHTGALTFYYDSVEPADISLYNAPSGYVDKGRRCAYILTDENTGKQYASTSVVVNDEGVNITYLYRIHSYDSRYEPPRYTVTDDMGFHFGDTTENIFATSLPIFESLEQAQNYILTGEGKEQAVNYKESDAEINHYYIYNKYGDAVASYGGLDFGNSTIYERYEEFDVQGGRACLYEPTPYEMTIVYNGTILGSKFSSIGQGVPEVVREDELYYTSPFYDKWDKNLAGYGRRYGDFRVAQYYCTTNMLAFKSLEDANAYSSGDDSVAQNAGNYEDVMTNGESGYTNQTGDSNEELTEFGESYHSAIFTKKYVMSKAQLQNIANNLYDNTGALVDNIKKGLEMWGQNPIEAVVNLTYFPLNMTEVLMTSPQSYVYFGGYKMDLPSNVQKVIYENGYKTMGYFTVKPSFGNSYRDYEPYSKLFVNLPYVGTYQLDIKRYINKTIEVRYYIDTTTGGCLACLIANGRLVDYFNGQMGVNQPMTATNFGEYANAQINTLLGAGQNILQNASTGASIGMAGGGVGMAVGAGISAGTGIIKDIVQTEYGLTENNINSFNKTKGGSSGKINEFLPQYVYFMYEIMDVKETDNLLSLHGKPSNASGSLGSFGGFLKCDNVKLECSGATAGEKSKILALLKSGIYI